MDFSEILNYMLYGFSGLCFGASASRYSVLATINLLEAYKEKGLSGVASCWFGLLFLIIAAFIFPIWFIGRTTVGGFCYYAMFIYFYNKGYQLYINNRRRK